MSSKLLNKTDSTVLAVLERRGQRTAKELARFLELDIDNIYKCLNKLLSLYFIDKTDDTPCKYYLIKEYD